MTILCIRTDKPEAELYIYANGQQQTAIKWQAHLRLAETLNSKVDEILSRLSISYDELDGIAIFKGPGSFTGLRIGMSVANGLAYSKKIPIIAKSGDGWLAEAVEALEKNQDDKVAVPEYGGPARTTKPRK